METTVRPAEFLTSILARGVRVHAVNDRLRVSTPPGALTDADRAVFAEHKRELRRLVVLTHGYRAVLRRAFQANATGTDRAQADAILDEQAKLTDDLSPALASAILREEARAWATAARRCPWCGAESVAHGIEGSQ